MNFDPRISHTAVKRVTWAVYCRLQDRRSRQATLVFYFLHRSLQVGRGSAVSEVSEQDASTAGDDGWIWKRRPSSIEPRWEGDAWIWHRLLLRHRRSTSVSNTCRRGAFCISSISWLVTRMNATHVATRKSFTTSARLNIPREFSMRITVWFLF